MTTNRYDIIIVGGGLIGLCLSYFLGKLGLSVSILDKDEITEPSIIRKDFRTTAISEGTKIIFDTFGIWRKIKKNAEPIKHIRIFDRNNTNHISFTNPIKNNFLGYIVENNFLKKIIISELISNKKINLLEKSQITNIQISDNLATISTKNKKLSSPLLVAADGKKSFVRKILKQPFFFKKYNQKALVVNLLHSKHHHNTAYEIFYDSGPLASLPMVKGLNNKNRSSLVWSHNPEFIEGLFNVNENFLSSLIEEQIENILGKVVKIENKQIFSLSAHINSSFTVNRTVFVGDAAHSIHPIAGQGWNLGMRDLSTLIDIINEAILCGIDLGSDFVCKQYHNKRYFDALSLYQITDKLNLFFMFEGFVSNKTRQTGFNVIDNSERLKKLITNYAMGNRS